MNVGNQHLLSDDVVEDGDDGQVGGGRRKQSNAEGEHIAMMSTRSAHDVDRAQKRISVGEVAFNSQDKIGYTDNSYFNPACSHRDSAFHNIRYNTVPHRDDSEECAIQYLYY